MVRSVFRNSGRLFSAVLAVVCITGIGTAASAATVAGCDPDVMSALSAKAEAQVAYDTAVTREIIDKPDSVLTLTCFSDAAGISAMQGGKIFSGDFTDSLKTVMSVTGNGTLFPCMEIDKLWKLVTDAGVNTGTPYATFDDMMGTTTPNGGVDFNAGWDAAKTASVFSDLKAAVDNLPLPAPLDFTTAKSSCEVLTIAGIGSCP